MTINNQLQAIFAVGSGEANAVGWSNNPNGPQFAHNTLIIHIVGSTATTIPSPWTETPTPNPNLNLGFNNDIRGMSALSATDIWAVGASGKWRCVL